MTTATTTQNASYIKNTAMPRELERYVSHRAEAQAAGKAQKETGAKITEFLGTLGVDRFEAGRVKVSLSAAEGVDKVLDADALLAELSDEQKLAIMSIDHNKLAEAVGLGVVSGELVESHTSTVTVPRTQRLTVTVKK